MATDDPDFTTMSDPDFLAERRRVRELLNRMPPGQSPGRAQLAARYAAMDAEFDRRAHTAWTWQTSQTAPPHPAHHNSQGEKPMNDDLRKKLLAIDVLLEVPEEISDTLESELYLLRDKLQVTALS